MSKFSLTGSSLLVFVITVLFNFAGVIPQDGQVTQLANDVVLFASLVGTIVGQMRRKDLKAGIVRKHE